MSNNSRKVTDLGTRSAGQIPWSEWSDAELNVEKWDTPKNGSDGRYLDPEPRAMPPSVEPHDWKRVDAVRSLSGNVVLFIPGNGYPDLVKNNKHILHSEFFRWFISTLINLQYAGRNGLRVEESPSFAWSGQTRPWQGWVHVYSLNKGGKTASQQQQQQPAVNPNGKYVVRLFFMGSWRRFLVDDMIPIDIHGTPLLPRTENEFELWPMLLAKAMIKVAALTWTKHREIRDFYPVSCLTGWICLPLVTKSLSTNEKWELLIRYLADSEQSIKEGNSLESRKKILLFATVTDTKDLSEDAVPGVTPCWSQFVYFDEARGASANGDQSIPPPQVRWKLHRWVKWAARHGLTEGEDYPISGARTLKVVSPLARYGREEDLGEVEGDSLMKSADTGVWVDFKKLAPYVDEIFMFYKPAEFKYHARISDASSTTTEGPRSVSAGGARGKSQPAGGRESKKATPARSSSVVGVPAFVSSLKWQRDVPNRRNDPLYMLIDSIETKFVLIDFSRMPRPRPALYDPAKDRRIRFYLLVERHCFFERSNDEDPVASIKTLSSGATVFESGPGRRLYRILFREEESYSMRILSNTIFYIGNRLKMQELMVSESKRIEAIAKGISNAMSSALQEFGGAKYASEVKALSRSYMPQEEERLKSDVEKREVKTIHRAFVEELVKLVRERLPTSADGAAACHALKVFFLDPTIGANRSEYKGHSQSEESPRYLESSETHQTKEERAAVRIQSFIRMSVMKIYKRSHLSSHTKHAEVANSLRKVVELFDFSKRESIAHLLIRRIISRGYQSLYPCHEDLNHVLDFEEWRGIARNIQPGQWVPLARVVLAPTGEGKVHASMDLATVLPRQMLRVVNNETFREVTRVVNSPATVHFPYIERGYTVICYGWSDTQKFKELSWLLRITTIRGQPRFRKQTVIPSLALQELADSYVPNASCIIGKWTVRVGIADSLLTFRLSTSYSGVEIVFKILDGEENVLYEISGSSTLILPAVYLPLILGDPETVESRASRMQLEETETARVRSRSKSLTLNLGKDADRTATEYYVRAYVKNDSWPLTPAEWSAVMEAKAKGTVYDPRQGRASTSSILKRGTRTRVGRDSQDHLGDGDAGPSWRLQILTDVGAKVQVEPDRRREFEIAEVKKTWEEAEAGRLQRGREAREAFLEEGWTHWKSSSTADFESETRESDDSGTEPGSLYATEIRTLKPPANISQDFPPWIVVANVFKEDEEEAEEERWVKTETDEEILRNQRAINVFDFDQNHLAFVDESEEVLRSQRHRYSKLFGSFIEKEMDWKSRSEAAYEVRDSYAAEVKAASSARPAVNKNTKEATDTTVGKKKKITKKGK